MLSILSLDHLPLDLILLSLLLMLLELLNIHLIPPVQTQQPHLVISLLLLHPQLPLLLLTQFLLPLCHIHGLFQLLLSLNLIISSRLQLINSHLLFLLSLSQHLLQPLILLLNFFGLFQNPQSGLLRLHLMDLLVLNLTLSQVILDLQHPFSILLNHLQLSLLDQILEHLSVLLSREKCLLLVHLMMVHHLSVVVSLLHTLLIPQSTH